MDPYKVLGVDRKADGQEIKRAFRELAKAHHPDKGGNEEKFKEIRLAHDILTDDGKRRHYDMTGQIPGEQSMAEQGGMPGGFQFPFDIGNLFGMFGQGGKPGGGRKGQKAPPKIEMLKLHLAQLYSGYSFTITLDRSRFCGPCAGSGAKRKESCQGCGGRGTKIQIMNLGGMVMQTQGPCDQCGGEGSKTMELCGTCEGKKRINEKKTLDVRIPAGTQTGDTFTFPEACSEVPEFEKAGDLQITVTLQETAGWKRIGSAGQHLDYEVPLSLAESLMGTRVKLDGHPGYDEGLFADVPPGSFSGDVYCLTGLGMPVKGSANAYGDLYLRIKTSIKPTERGLLTASGTQDLLRPLFGELRRKMTVEDEADVQKELFLTKLPE